MQGDELGRRRRLPTISAATAVLLLLGIAESAASDASDVRSILGRWRGSSACTDLAATPSCRDEVVIYDVGQADKAGVAKVVADKVVDKQRVHMGELEFQYMKSDGCWQAKLETARYRGVWCLVVEGSRMSGTLKLLPGGTIVRKVELRRE